MTLIENPDVHKLCRTQELITSFRTDGGFEGHATFDIPRAHWVVASSGGMPAQVPLILGFEVIRQTGIVAGQTLAGIPEDAVFILNSISFAWVSEPSFGRGASFTGTVHATVHDVTDRSCGYVFVVRDSEGSVIGEGTIHTGWVAPAIYKRIRRHAPAPVERFDNHLRLNSVQCQNGAVTAHLGWDTRDPFHFDHPVDHIPGMLFIDAAFTLEPDATGGAFSFSRYAELNEEVLACASDTSVTFTQAGQVIASGELKRA